MLEELFPTCQKVIDASEKKGVEAIEIFLSYNKQQQVILNGLSIGTQRAKEEAGAGIRVLHNNAEGFSYTNNLTFDSLLATALEAHSIAQHAPKIEGVALATVKTVPTVKGTYSQELAELSADALTKDGLNFLKGFTSIDPRIRTVLSNITNIVAERAIINSNGVKVTTKNSSFQAGLMAVASDKTRAGGYVFDDAFSRKHDVDFYSKGIELGKRAIDGLKQEPIKAFDGPIIFEPNAIFNPIAIVLGLTTSADWRQRGISFWRDKLADKVAAENFQLIDKPHDLQGGAGVRPFDDEGTPTNELPIIQDGILQTFLHNIRTANKENLESTGHAMRGLGNQATFTQKPTNAFFNSPWILAGDVSKEEMIQETRKGLIIHNYQGTVRHQNGIFSGVAKGAHLIENGEITKPVTGVSISGNVFDLINNIRAIGKEYHLASGFLTTPIIQFDGIRISTK